MVVCDELGPLRPLLLRRHTEQLHPCPHVLVLRSVVRPVRAPIPLVEEVYHSGATAAVCADNHPDQLRGPLAVHVPSWVAVLPDRIHDLSDHSLHKLLRSDLQQEGGLSEERAPEGPPERVRGCCERTHQQLFPGKQREAEETTEGLTPKS